MVEDNTVSTDELYRRLFETLADATIVVDAETGRIIDANLAAAHTYGRTRAELCALHSSALSAEPTRITDAAGPTVRTHKRKDGTSFPAEVTTSRLAWRGRDVVSVIVRDITDRGNALLDTQARMSTLSANLAEVVLYEVESATDTTPRRFTYVSQSCERMHGVSSEAVLHDAMTLYGQISPEDLAPLMERELAALQTMTPFSAEVPLRLPSGELRWRHFDSVPRRNADGSVTWFGVEIDVTQRRLAEDALRESKALVEAVVENVPLMVFLKEAEDLKFVMFNRAGEELVGYDRSAFLGKSDLDIFPPEQAAAFMATDRKVLEGSAVLDIPEERIQTAKKGLRLLHTRKVCIRGADGTTKYLLGVSEDVTESKQLRAAVAQSDRLASMGTLAAGIGHEINNPLAYVLANLDVLAKALPKVFRATVRCSEMLSDKLGDAAFALAVGDAAELVEPEKLADLLEGTHSALEGIHRIGTITRGLRAFSRVERDEVISVDVNRAIEVAATMAHNEVKYRASLVKEFGHVPRVKALEGKLSQVFLNLLINAAHAIAEGEADKNRVTVRTWVQGGDVLAEVSDTGRGIPAANLERIFDPFFTTKKVGEGSGLGLSISKNIIQEFGGEIRVESEPGKGTRFIVRLPAIVATVEPRADASAPRPADAAVRGRILVVDDEDPIRKTLVRLLGQQHEVASAASGREAKALLEKDQAFDLILCDLMMPEMTGMDLHAWLATHHPLLAERVVFVSGGAFTPTAAQYLANVGNPRVDKPFDPTMLKKLVTTLVTTARRKAALA